jgi:hypothetical protein
MILTQQESIDVALSKNARDEFDLFASYSNRTFLCQADHNQDSETGRKLFNVKYEWHD